jgi:hypothetical protein
MSNRSAASSLAVRALAFALLAIGASSCGSGSAPSPHTRAPVPTPSPVGLQTPSGNRAYLGVYANATHSSTDIATLEAQIGRKFALNMHYDSWTTNFPLTAENADLTAGRVSVDSWNCSPTNAQIVAGAADPLIQTRALAIKTFGRPIFLRYFWDMNLPSASLGRGACYDPSVDNPDGTFSAAEFVAAWQHIHDVFAQEGVNNVVWVWCPSASGANPTPFYPGSAYVDWIGVDAYDPTSQGFVATFSQIYPVLTQYAKPILVAETGDQPAAQPLFFQTAATDLPTMFPQIKGFMYFDSVAANTGINWRLTPQGIAALAAFGAQPYVSATDSP